MIIYFLSLYLCAVKKYIIMPSDIFLDSLCADGIASKEDLIIPSSEPEHPAKLFI